MQLSIVKLRTLRGSDGLVKMQTCSLVVLAVGLSWVALLLLPSCHRRLWRLMGAEPAGAASMRVQPEPLWSPESLTQESVWRGYCKSLALLRISIAKLLVHVCMAATHAKTRARQACAWHNMKMLPTMPK